MPCVIGTILTRIISRTAVEPKGLQETLKFAQANGPERGPTPFTLRSTGPILDYIFEQAVDLDSARPHAIEAALVRHFSTPPD
jgi:hypothetical protein